MNNYFHTIQTYIFYYKNVFEMFKPNFNTFLDLLGSCGKNKNKS